MPAIWFVLFLLSTPFFAVDGQAYIPVVFGVMFLASLGKYSRRQSGGAAGRVVLREVERRV